MNFEYRLATKKDLDALVGTRIYVLKAANELPDSTDMSVVTRESRRYYEQSFAKNTHVAYLVYSANKIVGAGGVSFYQVLPTFHNPSGEKADNMNMYKTRSTGAGG